MRYAIREAILTGQTEMIRHYYNSHYQNMVAQELVAEGETSLLVELMTEALNG